MDRIDIHIEVPPVNFKELSSLSESESSSEILKRVKRAREIQERRFKESNIYTNSRMNSREVRRFCKPDGNAMDLLEKGMERLSLSARAHDKILKVARTIADLDGSEKIMSEHIAEAIHYRSLDRRLLL